MRATLRAWPTTIGNHVALSFLAACGTDGHGNGDGDGPSGTQDLGFVVVDDPFADPPVPAHVEVSYPEAGDALTVTSNDAPYLTGEPYEAAFEGETFIGYASHEAATGELQGDLALTVDVDEFPGVDDAAFPEVPTFELTAPTDPGASDAVDASTTFSWTGATDRDDTLAQIELASSDSVTFVSRYAADTGSFELPAVTVTELGGSPAAPRPRAGKASGSRRSATRA